jgi:nucleotidyltransferase/DNA polymerase involved in DNA repair
MCVLIEAHHGIVLAENYPAKALGAKTDEAIWQAKQKYPGLAMVRADFSKYLVTADGHIQIGLFDNSKVNVETLAATIDNPHKRFGPNNIQRCAMLLNQDLSEFNHKDDHVIHPVSYFK